MPGCRSRLFHHLSCLAALLCFEAYDCLWLPRLPPQGNKALLLQFGPLHPTLQGCWVMGSFVVWGSLEPQFWRTLKSESSPDCTSEDAQPRATFRCPRLSLVRRSCDFLGQQHAREGFTRRVSAEAQKGLGFRGLGFRVGCMGLGLEALSRVQGFWIWFRAVELYP